MSPRSKEFYDRARERLMWARRNLEQGGYAIAVGAAYYSMLYGARAALSERDLHAKTHRGTWNLFRQTFVAGGSLPAELVGEAERLAELREAADYDALAVEREQAEGAVASAERFLSALDELLD
ncbi:MAG: HEPN domain-containing protein [Solirubrobacterales bacterium]